MTIQTERLTLRPVLTTDWQAIQSIWEDQKHSPYARYDRHNDTSDEAVRLRIAKWEERGKGKEHLFFAVCISERVIGYVALNAREDGYEIGYCFHSAYHGKGYARESISRLIAHVQTLGAPLIVARTAMNNLPSVRLLTSLGFRLAGTEQVSFYKDEAGRDIFFEGGIFELSLS
ncbi:MAG: GNAT family N-acetyltransferase [Clostridia bacterium]|nr:GNAT family N-acetyltransferase [Clostridia bacterium]